MFFNPTIRQTIIASIETYNDVPRYHISPADQKRLSRSCLDKLTNFSIATVFSKQEYTLMYLAMVFISDLSERTDTDICFDPEPIIDRLEELIEA